MAFKGKAVDDFSSSDEAPEEEGFQAAALKTKAQAKERKKVLDTANKIQKEKRRAQDSRLKEQKRKLLTDLLKDVEEDDEDETPVVVKPISSAFSAPRRKTLELEKDGISVKVAEKANRKLPPPKSSLLAQREKFLSRKSVSRR